MCHHNNHFGTYEQSEYGNQKRYEQSEYGDQRRYEQNVYEREPDMLHYGDQRRHKQPSHANSHFVWFLFPSLFFLFFAFHAWNAFGVLFWVVPAVLFVLSMKAGFCKPHLQEAPAVLKDEPFYTPLSSRSDEQYAQPMLYEQYAQEDVVQQEMFQQEELEYRPLYVEEQPQSSYSEA